MQTRKKARLRKRSKLSNRAEALKNAARFRAENEFNARDWNYTLWEIEKSQHDEKARTFFLLSPDQSCVDDKPLYNTSRLEIRRGFVVRKISSEFS